MSRLIIALVVLLATAPARAESNASYVLFRLDPLGIEPDIVTQLEGILRVELQRVVGALPTAAEVNKVVAASPKLQACTGDPTCLVPLARALAPAGGRVIAFEPVPENLERLRWAIDANALQAHVDVVPVALGEQPGELGMWLKSSQTGASSGTPVASPAGAGAT